MAIKEDWFESEDNYNLVEHAYSLDIEHNGVLDTDGKKILFGHELRALPSLVRFMRMVFRTKDVPYTVTVDKHGRRQAVEASLMAKSFYQINGMLELYSRDYHYAPGLQLVFDVFAFHEIRTCMLNVPNQPMGDGRIEAEVFNDFVKILREEGARVSITQKMNDWQNAIDDNVKRTEAYVDALFARYPQLKVVDLYLGYRDACVDPARLFEVEMQVKRQAQCDKRYLYGDAVVEQHPMETRQRFDVSPLVADRKRLFANMRSKPSIFGSLVGYVWRVEWSRVCGCYLRVTFLFDIAAVNDDIHLSDLIGNYWVETTTDGRGMYRNSNDVDRQYGDSVGFGEVGRHDSTKRENLKRTLSYRAKRNQYVYVVTTPKTKLFGTGHMPNERPAAGGSRMKGSEGDE